MWKVTLYNQHAMCGIYAKGRTRRKAFDAAFANAGEPFLAYGVDGYAVSWLALFNDARAYMRRGSTSTHLQDPRGFGVEIRRVEQA